MTKCFLDYVQFFLEMLDKSYVSNSSTLPGDRRSSAENPGSTPGENYCLPHRRVLTFSCIVDKSSCDVVDLDDRIGTAVYCPHRRVTYLITDYHTFACQNYAPLQYLQLNYVLAIREWAVFNYIVCNVYHFAPHYNKFITADQDRLDLIHVGELLTRQW